METWSCAPLAGESKPSLRVFVNSTGARLESSRGCCHGRQQHTGVPPWNRTYNDHSSSIPQMAGPSPRQCPNCAPPGSFGFHARLPDTGVPPWNQTYHDPSFWIPVMPPPPMQCPNCEPQGFFGSHQSFPSQPNHQFTSTDANLPPVHPEARLGSRSLAIELDYDKDGNKLEPIEEIHNHNVIQ